MDKNLLICLSCGIIVENMDEINLDYEEIRSRFSKIRKDNRFILADLEISRDEDLEIWGEGYIVLRKNDLEYLKDFLGNDLYNNVSIPIESLSEIVMMFKEQYTFGIKEFEDFNFYWDEVYSNIEYYFMNEEFADEIFNNINEKGLKKYVDDIYKKEVKSMIEYKFKQLQDIINNLEIKEW